MIEIILGVVFILLGIVTTIIAWQISKGKALNLIAGYNTKTSEEKEKVDKNSLKFFTSSSLFAVAIMQFIFGIAFFINMTDLIVYVFIGTFIGFPLIGIVLSSIHQKTKKKFIIIIHKIFIVIAVSVFLGVTIYSILI